MRSVLALVTALGLFLSAAPARAADDPNAGLDALDRGDYAEAVRIFTNAINSGTLSRADTELAYVKRAQAYLGERQDKPALADLEAALKLDPNDGEAIALKAQAEAQSGGARVISAEVGRALVPAQSLLAAHDFAGAMIVIRQAQALPNQTSYETFVIDEFLANAAIGLQDFATADAAYEAMADSPDLTNDVRIGTFKNAAILANQYGHYTKAIQYAKSYLALINTPDPIVLSALATAFYNTHDYADAQAAAQESVDATPPGQSPNAGALSVLSAIQQMHN